MTIDNLPEPGSTITAYCSDTFIKGDVLCIDVPKKLIVLRNSLFSSKIIGVHDILEKASSNDHPDTCDILILKAEYLRDLKSISKGSPPPCPELSITKIVERIRANERIQQEKLKFYGHDVPTEARELAEYLETVVWDKPNVVVMEHTIISPPYKEGNVSCNLDTQQAKSQTEYVQKMVRSYQERVLENRSGN